MSRVGKTLRDWITRLIPTNHNAALRIHIDRAWRNCCTIATVAMAPDIVTNAIVAAISAGAVAGAADTAKSAIADAYQGLKVSHQEEIRRP
jgi:hypothetical protein